MTRFPIFAFFAAAISLTSCTLTPSRFDGYDLLDTGHKTENQDPVAVPIKEVSDKPRIKTSPRKIEPPVFAKPAEIKPEEKPPIKIEMVKPEVKAEVKPVVKAAPKKEDAKPEVIKADPCVEAKKGVLPPPRPDATPQILKSGDRIKITVFREKDLTGDYQINDKGMITFPLIGEVQSAGVTPSQLQTNLVSALSKGYLVKPEVNVERLPDCNSK